ncbi:hypothetical protein [Corynebacterium sp. 13CS0277]|uniref:hypothetical protein n=1 Tax=Corynebacterium sp. 13CS0277 TaxID=2071994 RepID=UPI001304D2BB|nr:hypothetical protein [Corynebacterium sp. 13CS0277]
MKRPLPLVVAVLLLAGCSQPAEDSSQAPSSGVQAGAMHGAESGSAERVEAAASSAASTSAAGGESDAVDCAARELDSRRVKVLAPSRLAGSTVEVDIVARDTDQDAAGADSAGGAGTGADGTECAPLGWAVVRASVEGRTREGVVWFRRGVPVDDPHPVLLPGVVSVTRKDPHTAEVVYLVEGADPAHPTNAPGERRPAPEGFVAAPVTVTTVFAPARSVTIAGNELPARANAQAVQLSLE